MADPSKERTAISFIANGKRVALEVEPRQHLAGVLRSRLSMTGTHLGCEQGICGACNVLLDGVVVRGCLTLAIQADGRNVDTIEGLSQSGAIAELQRSFVANNALQCGFCTSGMLLTLHELYRTHPDAAEDDIRLAISGNVCRCTGYQKIIEAALIAFRAKNERSSVNDGR